jgi:hypothetical protein
VILLSELQYNPPIAFFAALRPAEKLLLEAQENYRKQTYRNRCLILTAQGIQPLTVPVLDGSRSEKVKTAEIEIDYRQNWIHRHWRTLQTAYGNSPYFEYYADYFHDIYVQKHTRLFDLNLALLRLLLRCLRLAAPLELTGIYELAYPSPVLDFRDCLTPKAARAPTQPDSPAVTPPIPYQQAFGAGFEPGLSLLDLLFMQGPAAGDYF